MPSTSINVNLNYNATVRKALNAGQQILAQLQQMERLQAQQYILTEKLLDATTDLGNKGAQSIDKATTATKRWGTELTRIGVFANKTLASISGAINSFATQIGRVFSTFGSGFGGAGSSISGFIESFSRSITDFVGSGGFIQQLTNAVAVGAGGIVKVGAKIGQFLIQGLGTGLSQLPKVLGNLLQIGGQLGGLATGIGGAFFKAGGLAAGLFVSGIANAAGSIVGSFGTILQGITDLTAQAFGAVGEIIGQTLESSIAIVGSFADRITSVFGSLASTIGDLFGKAFTAAAAIAIPVGFKAARFRDSLSATFGVVVDELSRAGFDALVEDAKKVAVEIGISLSQVPDALFKTVSPGFKGTTETIKDFRAAAKLAAIGNVEFAQSIEATNRIIAAYGDRVGSVEDISVKLFNATRIGQLEVEDLTTNLGLVAGAAAQAGIPLNDLLTTFNLAAEVLPASRVATGLANTLKALNKPSKNAAENFADFFDAVRTSTGGVISFRRVLEELEQTGIIKDPEKFRRIFPDERGARAIVAAYQKAGEGLGEFDNRLRIVTDSAEAFNQVSDLALNTISRRFTSLGAAVISIGDTFLEKFKQPIIESLNTIIDGVGVLSQRLAGLDPSFITGFAESVANFIGTIPDRAASAAEALTKIKNVIVDSATAAKNFADEMLNFSGIVSAIADGNFGLALDEFLGSKAVEKARTFFDSLVDTAEDAFNRILTIGKSIFKGLGGLISNAFNNSPILKFLVPNGASLSDIDPAEFALQSVFGVNPIQSAASRLTQTATSGGIGAGSGAGIGAGIGAFFGPGGALLGGGIGAGIGGLIGIIRGWINSAEETKTQQDAIRDFLKQIREEVEREKELAIRRREAQEQGAAALEASRGTIAELELIQQRSKAIEEDRNKKVQQLRLAELDLYNQRDDQLKKILEFEKTYGGTVEAVTEKNIEIRTVTEITLAEERRSAEVARRIADAREKVEESLIEVEAKIEETKRELDALINPVRISLTRVGGTRATIGTSRFTDTIGGVDEGKLVDAIRKLIQALDENTAAEKAVKEALKPFNLDENLKGLNTRARVQIRRSKERRLQEQANFINSQFDSFGFSDIDGGANNGIFGFGSAGPLGAFAQALRSLSFGGGFGFRTSLPGEDRRLDDRLVRAIREATVTNPLAYRAGGREIERAVNFGLAGGGGSGEFIANLLSSLSGSGGSFLRPGDAASGRDGIIDVREFFGGGLGLRGRVRGRPDPFSGSKLGDGSINAIREAILDLADVALSGSSTKGREVIADLTRESADALKENGKTAESQLKILQEVATRLYEVLDRDRETAKADRETSERAKKSLPLRERLDELLGEADRLRTRRDGIEAEVEGLVPKVDAKGIGERVKKEEEAKRDALLKPLESINASIEEVRSEIERINAEAFAKLKDNQELFLQTFEASTTTLENIAETTAQLYEKSYEVAVKVSEAYSKLQDRQLDTLAKYRQLQEIVNRLGQTVKGKDR